ncbi:MAG: DUF975 family protein [Clostridia bacterium]|nr:DUF975 family protein [Clostridia bacterium]
MYDSIIVRESCSSIRALSREILSGKWKQAVIAVLIYMAAVTLPVELLNLAFGADEYDSFASAVYLLIVTGPFTFGSTVFFLSMVRGGKSKLEMLFCGFERFGRTLGLFAYIYLFTLLWTLLFVIPGFIAMLRYSQAFLVAAEHPEYTVPECVEASKRMMKGNKWSYFCLMLSFIGWYVLAMLPNMIAASLLSLAGASGTVINIVSYITSVPMLWVLAYCIVAEIVFYEIMTGNLRPGTIPAGFTVHGEQQAGRQSFEEEQSQTAGENRNYSYKEVTPEASSERGEGFSYQTRQDAQTESSAENTGSQDAANPQQTEDENTPEEENKSDL